MSSPLLYFPSVELKVHELFMTWVSESATFALIDSWVFDAKTGTALRPAGEVAPLLPGQPGVPFLSPSATAGTTLMGPTSPRSPRPSRLSQTNLSGQVQWKVNRLQWNVSDDSGIRKSVFQEIDPEMFQVPPFFQKCVEIKTNIRVIQQENVVAAFGESENSLLKNKFESLLKGVIGLPSFLSTTMLAHFSNIDEETITLTAFLRYCHLIELFSADRETVFFNVLRKQKAVIEPADFSIALRELVCSHPGLAFLDGTPEFQERYVETVIVRFFYDCNLMGDWKMTLNDVKRSCLLDVWDEVDGQNDVNLVSRFFSYEHFYVLYCKFWELDNDHDLEVSREDVAKYNEYALSPKALDRIFSGVPRKLSGSSDSMMTYRDFVWFLLSEEDKSSETSLKYWFKVADLDGDGVLSFFELEFFYSEQVKRLQQMQVEPVSFGDVLCQMLDMISPLDKKFVSLSELRRCGMASNLFNILFNINKFLSFEHKDPYMSTIERDGGLSDWEVFARTAYDKLAMEDDDHIDDEYSWDSSVASEAPF